MTSRRSAIRGVVLCLVFAAVSIGMILWPLAREGGAGPSAAPQASAAPRRTEVVPLADPGEPPRAELPAAPERVPTATETLELAAAAPQPTPGGILDLSPRTVFIEVQSQLGEREGFSVAGRVVLDELRPPLSAVVPDDGTVCCEGGDRLDRRWRVDDQGGLADVVVELVRDPLGLQERRHEEAPVRVLDDRGDYRVRRKTPIVRVSDEAARQARARTRRSGTWVYNTFDPRIPLPEAFPIHIRCCRFEPRVLAVPPLSRVMVINDDDYPHPDGLDGNLGTGSRTTVRSDPEAPPKPRADPGAPETAEDAPPEGDDLRTLMRRLIPDPQGDELIDQEVLLVIGSTARGELLGRVLLRGDPPLPRRVVPEDARTCCGEDGDVLGRGWKVDDEGGMGDLVVELRIVESWTAEQRARVRSYEAMSIEDMELLLEVFRRQPDVLPVELDREVEIEALELVLEMERHRRTVANRPRRDGSLPDATVEIVCCRFEPHVSIASADGRILVRNQDGVHHANGLTEAQLPPGHEASFETGRPTWPTARELSSWLDSWMRAYVYVAETTDVTLTEDSGRFVLRAVPAGPVALRLWHPVLGAAEVGFELPLPPDGAEVLLKTWLQTRSSVARSGRAR